MEISYKKTYNRAIGIGNEGACCSMLNKMQKSELEKIHLSIASMRWIRTEESQVYALLCILPVLKVEMPSSQQIPMLGATFRYSNMFLT
jgi:hypothetical protein